MQCNPWTNESCITNIHYTLSYIQPEMIMMYFGHVQTVPRHLKRQAPQPIRHWEIWIILHKYFFLAEFCDWWLRYVWCQIPLRGMKLDLTDDRSTFDQMVACSVRQQTLLKPVLIQNYSATKHNGLAYHQNIYYKIKIQYCDGELTPKFSHSKW